MQFNSFEFLWFALCLFILYWVCHTKKHLQNLLLLAGSYYFYSCLHWLFPVYLLALTVTGYLSALLMDRHTRYRKIILIAGIVLLSTCLLLLKYVNFGISILAASGSNWHPLTILVPVGLSFYTLSSIGYITDVYRRRIDAERNPVTYGAYISFFPHLLAGPIPAATVILPQFRQQRKFTADRVEPAIQQICWGLFKKMVIADNISIPVNYCFTHIPTLNSFGLYLGIVLFSFQIYADFSGYSEIARGVAGLFGIDLIPNFRLPFLSRNPAEFWRRWHTSLTRWLTDYLYIPLGGRSADRSRYITILLFIFLFSGLWHGASWTYVLWGLLNGLYFLPYLFTNTLIRYHEPPDPGRSLPTPATFFKILLTFHLITFSRILFKSTTLTQAGQYAKALFTQHSLRMPPGFLFAFLHWCILLVVIEWFQRTRPHPLAIRAPAVIRYAVYLAVAVLIMLYHKTLSSQEYYYFRF